MNYISSVEQMESGKKVARSSWNCKELFIELIKSPINSKYKLPNFFINFPLFFSEEVIKEMWSPSVTDVTAEDWEIVSISSK